MLTGAVFARALSRRRGKAQVKLSALLVIGRWDWYVFRRVDHHCCGCCCQCSCCSLRCRRRGLPLRRDWCGASRLGRPSLFLVIWFVVDVKRNVIGMLVLVVVVGDLVSI